MTTIYRRAKVIARCGRAEVLAGLKSGRFEPTDHYESPETNGWVSLTHFESRTYERLPRPVDDTSGSANWQRGFLFTPADDVGPETTTQARYVPDPTNETVRRVLRTLLDSPSDPTSEPNPHPLIALLGIVAAPFVFVRGLLDILFDTAWTILAQLAAVIIPILILIAIAIGCFFFPFFGGILLVIGLYLKKRDRSRAWGWGMSVPQNNHLRRQIILRIRSRSLKLRTE